MVPKSAPFTSDNIAGAFRNREGGTPFMPGESGHIDFTGNCDQKAEKIEEEDEGDDKVEDIIFKCEICGLVCRTNTELECHIKCEHTRPRTNPFEAFVIDRSQALSLIHI